MFKQMYRLRIVILAYFPWVYLDRNIFFILKLQNTRVLHYLVGQFPCTQKRPKPKKSESFGNENRNRKKKYMHLL